MVTHLYAISTNQNKLHPELWKTVQKHARFFYQRPISARQQAIFKNANDFVTRLKKPIIIDSGCGTGQSTQILAQKFPDHFIIGVDKSIKRLERHQKTAVFPNYLLLPMYLEDFWRLCVEHAWPITHHFMFYPNPWPKAAHVKRRWHGHPVFPTLLKLAPYLEIRSDFRLYLDEFSESIYVVTGKKSEITENDVSSPISLFEKKYIATSRATYRLVFDTSASSAGSP